MADARGEHTPTTVWAIITRMTRTRMEPTGGYSRWFREAIKDEDLAAAAAHVEGRPDVPPAESRALIRAAIEQRYTAPA